MSKRNQPDSSQNNANNTPLSFDYIYEGFAKTIENGIPYLHHRDGDKFRLATTIEEVHEETEAINFIKLELEHIPDSIFKCKKLKLLWLDNNEIEELPTAIGQFADLIWLDIRNNKVSKIPTEIGKLTNLLWLYLSNNPINRLPKEIGQLKNLNTIWLDQIKLTELPKGIGGLRNLNILRLDQNKLSELPREIGKLKNLSRLRLDYNQLTKLPKEIGRLKSLKYLLVDWNQLMELPKEIGQLKNLSNLVLINNQLPELPKEIGQLKNLSSLELFGNQLSGLPKEIGQLKNLSSLRLGSNQLSGLPKEIGQLKNLNRLTIYSNQLTELPKEIGQLKNLSSLSLENNQLSELPKEIGQLKNLSRLSLKNNQLVSIPAEIGQLSALTSLELESNKLKSLPSFPMSNLKGLLSLDVSKNKLKKITPEFCQSDELVVLHLSDNQLPNLPKEIGQLANLERLFLGNNQLPNLPKEIGQLVNLEGLDLQSNQLKHLPKEMGQLVKLKSLNLHYNELSSLPVEFDNLSNLSGFILENRYTKNIVYEIGKLKTALDKREAIAKSMKSRKASWTPNELDLNLEKEMANRIALKRAKIEPIDWSKVMDFAKQNFTDNEVPLEKLTTYLKKSLVKDLVTFEEVYGYKGNEQLILCLILGKVFLMSQHNYGYNGLYSRIDLITPEQLTKKATEQLVQTIPGFVKLLSSCHEVGNDGSGGYFFSNFIDSEPDIYYWDHEFGDGISNLKYLKVDWQSILKNNQKLWLLELSKIIATLIPNFIASPTVGLTMANHLQDIEPDRHLYGCYMWAIIDCVTKQEGYSFSGVNYNFNNSQLKELFENKESDYYQHGYVRAKINAEVVLNYHTYYFNYQLDLLEELLIITKDIRGGYYQVIRAVFEDLFAGKPNYGVISSELIAKIQNIAH